MLPPLRAVVAFEAAARRLSFARAAEELGVSRSAVSHQIELLERFLGASLFRRSAAGVALTPAGRRYFEGVEAAVAAVAEATRAVRGRGASARLTVHTPVSLSALWLRPLLGGFVAANPRIALRLVSDAELPNFAEVDLAICYGSEAGAGLARERLLAESLQPLCGPALRAALPARPRPRDLRAQTLIHSYNTIGWRDWFSHMGERVPPGEGLRFDRSHLAIEAAVDGLGVVLESDILTRDAIARGRLVPIFTAPKARMDGPGYWLAAPPRRLREPPVRRFLAWLRAEIAKG